MVVGVGVHVRLVAESLIRHPAPHLNHTVQGQGPRRHRWRTSPYSQAVRQHRLYFFLMPSPAAPPDALRQQLRARRLLLSTAERQIAALAVARRLAETAEFIAASNVAGYWACNGELDPAPLLERAWASGKAVYLPVVAGAALQFAPYQPNAPLRRNRFHIPEPEVSPAEWLPPSALDLVLTPLVAFDATGTRLGMGGGFYDRSFAFLRDPPRPEHRPRLIGLAYEFQRVDALVRQAWDVPLDAAATETAWQVFR